MAVLGNNSIYASTRTAGSGYLCGQKFTLSEAGTMTAFHAYVYMAASQNYRFAVYKDGSPKTRTWQSDSLSARTTAGWADVTGLSVALTAADYWLCWNADNAINFYYDAGISNPFYSELTYGEFPATTTGLDTDWGQGNVSIYIEYTAGGGSVDVTPTPAIIAGTGSQATPVISGEALKSPNHIIQLAELKDPILATTRNLGIGNYRSTTVLMNW